MPPSVCWRRSAGISFPWGAGELAARGIDAAGLVYGYRLDGESPALDLSVQRHVPLLSATAVTTISPAPRRIDVGADVVFEIRRAGVRRLYVDVPAWAEASAVVISSPQVRSTERLADADAPGTVPAGFARWQVDLRERVIGRHTLRVSTFREQGQDDWSLDAALPMAVAAPADRLERVLLVRRASGLEVQTSAPEGARAIDPGEVPGGLVIDPAPVLQAYRLADGADGVGVRVTQHGGAAVLDAIATHVRVATAIGAEGILRTRARAVLFNVDRQFLEVRLPPDSHLIGAVVDEKPVKPLRTSEGHVLVPIPTARGPGQRTRADLTYQTQVGGEVEDGVEVRGPEFPGLEVLTTEHIVAFEPSVVIDGVEGDFVSQALPGSQREPWLASLFGADAPAAGTDAGPSFTDGRGLASRSGDAELHTGDDIEFCTEAGTYLPEPMSAEEPIIRDEEVSEHPRSGSDGAREELVRRQQAVAEPGRHVARGRTLEARGDLDGALAAYRSAHAVVTYFDPGKSVDALRIGYPGDDRTCQEQAGRDRVGRRPAFRREHRREPRHVGCPLRRTARARAPARRGQSPRT